jgi:hypothetical protein
MTDAASLGPRLEEIHLLDEWEKSLVTPGMADKENRA